MNHLGELCSHLKIIVQEFGWIGWTLPRVDTGEGSQALVLVERVRLQEAWFQLEHVPEEMVPQENDTLAMIQTCHRHLSMLQYQSSFQCSHF